MAIYLSLIVFTSLYVIIIAVFKVLYCIKRSMEINVARVNNGICDVHVISDDEYIGPSIARGHEWDAWMRRMGTAPGVRPSLRPARK